MTFRWYKTESKASLSKHTHMHTWQILVFGLCHIQYSFHNALCDSIWQTSSLCLSPLHAGTHQYTFLGSDMFIKAQQIIQQDYGSLHMHREHTYTPHTQQQPRLQHTMHTFTHMPEITAAFLSIHHNASNKRLMNNRSQLPKHAQTHKCKNQTHIY